MNEIENNIETENIIKDIKIGQLALFELNSGGAVCGLITSYCESIIQDDTIVKSYRISLGGQKYIDVCDLEISGIYVYDPINKDQYFEELKEKYGVDLSNEDGSTRNIADIINELLVLDVWDKLNDAEKETFLNVVSMDSNAQIDLINALDKSRKRNNELHKKVLDLMEKRNKVLQSDIDFQKNYDKIASTIPECKWAFDFYYKLLGIDKLLRAR